MGPAAVGEARRMTPLVSVMLHTQRSLRHTGEYDVHRGWWADDPVRNATDVAEATSRWGECCARTRGNLAEVFKWDWLATALADSRAPPLPRARARSDRPARGEEPTAPVILADADVVFQCTAAELRRRFERLGAALVLSGEKTMWPGVRQPAVGRERRWTNWSAVPSPFQRHARSRQSELTYPNGGLLMGTREGLLSVRAAMRTFATYPCCPASAYGSSAAHFVLPPCKSCSSDAVKQPACAVSSQACLQATLLRSHKLDTREAVIDENATLFLSFYGLEPGELALDDEGHIRHVPTGTSPCVLHLNGEKNFERLRRVHRLGTKPLRTTWVPYIRMPP